MLEQHTCVYAEATHLCLYWSKTLVFILKQHTCVYTGVTHLCLYWSNTFGNFGNTGKYHFMYVQEWYCYWGNFNYASVVSAPQRMVLRISVRNEISSCVLLCVSNRLHWVKSQTRFTQYIYFFLTPTAGGYQLQVSGAAVAMETVTYMTYTSIPGVTYTNPLESNLLLVQNNKRMTKTRTLKLHCVI